MKHRLQKKTPVQLEGKLEFDWKERQWNLHPRNVHQQARPVKRHQCQYQQHLQRQLRPQQR